MWWLIDFFFYHKYLHFCLELTTLLSWICWIDLLVLAFVHKTFLSPSYVIPFFPFSSKRVICRRLSASLLNDSVIHFINRSLLCTKQARCLVPLYNINLKLNKTTGLKEMVSYQCRWYWLHTVNLGGSVQE